MADHPPEDTARRERPQMISPRWTQLARMAADDALNGDRKRGEWLLGVMAAIESDYPVCAPQTPEDTPRSESAAPPRETPVISETLIARTKVRISANLDGIAELEAEDDIDAQVIADMRAETQDLADLLKAVTETVLGRRDQPAPPREATTGPVMRP